ncbi:MAG: hypothetical protein ACOVT5_10910 [Armatimonadaceae bacterium]
MDIARQPCIVPLAAATSARLHGISLYRCHVLALNLSSASAALAAGHANEVPHEHLDAYLRLNWMDRVADGLQLTDAGQRVCAAVARS